MTLTSSPSEGGRYDPFPTFAFVWAVTTLVHQLAFTFWTETWEGWVLVIAAAATLFRPACLFRFAILVLASMAHLWEKLPFVPNHILFEGMLHLVMLVALGAYFLSGPGRSGFRGAWSAWKGRFPLLVAAIVIKVTYFLAPIPLLERGHLLGSVTTLFLLIALGRFLAVPVSMGGGDEFFRRVAPVLRVAVVIMYLWAGVQKLNRDYFDETVSCAGKLHLEIADYFGGLVPTAPWTLTAAAAGSLFLELGIPLLLCLRRTRYVGFVVAVIFHLWLSIHPAAGIFSFTSMILALLLLFLPQEWGRKLQALWDGAARRCGGGDLARGRRRGRILVLVVFGATLVTQASLYLVIGRSYEVFHTANRVGFFAFFAWALWIGGSYLVAGARAKGASGPLAGRAAPTLAWLALVPVLLNGAWPWLGSRTQTSFSMYSNLRSEAAGNHLFLKRADLFDLQKDMVEVLTAAPDILGPSSKPRGIQQFANLGYRVLPWFEFRRVVSEHEGDFEVTYTRNGREESLGRRGGETFGDPEAFRPLPLLARKFLWFRRLESLDGPMPCTH